MAADDEIVVALTAQTDQLNEGMAQASAQIEGMQATVQQEAQAFNAAVQSKIDAMTRLNAAFATNVGSVDGMAEAESALDQAMSTGAITAEEYAGYVAQLDAAEAAAATAATTATAAMEAQNAAMNVSGGVARELGVLIGELARGNYTRLEGSTITLANRTGVLSSALSFLLSPLGLVAAAAVATGYEVYEAGQQFNAMRDAILATGDASGMTAGQLTTMADRIAETTGNYSNAREAVQKLAESGRFAGESFQLVAQAASQMSQLTGESVNQTVEQFVRLQEDPVKAAAKLNDQLHALTATQFQQIESLAQSGDTMGAARVAYEAFAAAMEQRSQTSSQQLGILDRTIRQIKTDWTDAMEEFSVNTGGGDTAERLTVQLRNLKAMLDTFKDEGSHGFGAAVSTDQLTRQTQVVQQLTAQLNQQRASVQGVGQAAQQSASQIDAMAKAFKSSSSDHSAAQQDKEQFDEMQLTRTRSLQEERAYWELILQTSQQGSDEYRQAIQQLIEIHNKEGEAAKEAARKNEEATRQRNAAVMTELSEEREETQAASAERIAIDAQAMDKAVQLYGQQSAQFKRALAQRLEDTKAFVDATVQEEKKAEEQVEEIYKRQTDAAIKAVNDVYTQRQKSAQDEVQLGQITTSQELQLLRQYADEEYATDLAILEHYRQMMAEKPNVVAAINGQIEQLEQKHADTLNQINQKTALQYQQSWTQALQPIDHAFNTAINGMIQGTQTWQQITQRILQSVLSSYLEMGIKILEDWVAKEAARLAASISTSTQQTTVQSTQRAINSAADAAASAASVARAAGVAGAQGVASFSGAPWPIDMGAPAFGASMMTAALSYGSVASAAGGWDRVPFDDAPALLHRNEMVLPASLSERIRGMTDSGGGSNATQHIHIQANDAKSFEKMLTANPNAFAKAARRAIGNGGRRR